jgi:hypothetical protein
MRGILQAVDELNLETSVGLRCSPFGQDVFAGGPCVPRLPATRSACSPATTHRVLMQEIYVKMCKVSGCPAH